MGPGLGFRDVQAFIRLRKGVGDLGSSMWSCPRFLPRAFPRPSGPGGAADLRRNLQPALAQAFREKEGEGEREGERETEREREREKKKKKREREREKERERESARASERETGTPCKQADRNRENQQKP